MKPTDNLIVGLTALGIMFVIISSVIIRERRKQTKPVSFKDILHTVRQDGREYLDSVLSVVRSIVLFVVSVLALLGGLWLLVAVVKWMWQHS